MQQLEKLREKLQRALENANKYESLAFDEIGFDMLVIDEAHFYKNLYVPGKAGQVKGMKVSDTNKTTVC